jgi:hypothetical protein
LHNFNVSCKIRKLNRVKYVLTTPYKSGLHRRHQYTLSAPAKMVLSLVVLFALVSSASCGFFDIGPLTTVAQFKGRITYNGRPVAAHVSLEVQYKVNGDEFPVSLV